MQIGCIVCLYFCGQITAQNTLTVADFTAAAGKEAAVPIYLTNSNDVVGLQFDIQLPYAKSGSDVTIVSSRSNGHTVSLRKHSNLEYTVVVMSLQNNALRGNAGQLLRFPISVSSDAQADEEFPISISNIVLTDRQGHNIATESTSSAVFTVQRTPTPDFVIENLAILNSGGQTSPGGKLYTVERTTVEDEYVVVLTMDVVPDIPQAIVVPTLPGNWGCGTNTYSIRLTNKGRLTAYNPYMGPTTSARWSSTRSPTRLCLRLLPRWQHSSWCLTKRKSKRRKRSW